MRDIFDARRSSRKTIDQSGVWRFRERVLDIDASQIITHPEGGTRLYERDGIFFKHEGENPTGSFKDRGMTVAITQAVREGAVPSRARRRKHERVGGRVRCAGGIARDRFVLSGNRRATGADACVRRALSAGCAATSTPP
jgi:hypothetical protein